jgi:hypothetical protein
VATFGVGAPTLVCTTGEMIEALDSEVLKNEDVVDVAVLADGAGTGACAGAEVDLGSGMVSTFFPFCLPLPTLVIVNAGSGSALGGATTTGSIFSGRGAGAGSKAEATCESLLFRAAALPFLVVGVGVSGVRGAAGAG